MFHLIALRRFTSVNWGSVIIYGILLAIYMHYSLSQCMEQQVYGVTHPKVKRYYNLSSFKEKFSSCYTSNKTSGDRDVNDNEKALIVYNLIIGYPIVTMGLVSFAGVQGFVFALLAAVYPIIYVPRELNLWSWKFGAFSHFERAAENWLKAFPVFLSIVTVLLATSSYCFHYAVLAGHFFDLGIRSLRDPGYLSTIFPEMLYCYHFNEKGEELFWACLILWFWMAFVLIVQMILMVQLFSIRHSKFYRFRRLKKFFPSEDEQHLRRLSEQDYLFCISLEYFDCFADRQEFRKFLDELGPLNHHRFMKIMKSLPNKDKPDPNALALVAVK